MGGTGWIDVAQDWDSACGNELQVPKNVGIWLDEYLLASQDGLCSTDLIS